MIMQLPDIEQEKSQAADDDLRFDRENESTTGEPVKKIPPKEQPVKNNVSPVGIPPLTEEEKVPKLKEEDQKKEKQ
jgi:hypothetical protein